MKEDGDEVVEVGRGDVEQPLSKASVVTIKGDRRW